MNIRRWRKFRRRFRCCSFSLKKSSRSKSKAIPDRFPKNGLTPRVFGRTIPRCLRRFRFARELFGAFAAVLAVALFVLEPTVMAHGRVVQTDIPATLGYLLLFVAL